MNGSSENITYFDRWSVCLHLGYVPAFLYHAAQVLCFLLGTPALVWCLWISLSGNISRGLKPTLVFTIHLFVIELVFCFQGLLEVITYLLIHQNATIFRAVYALYSLTWTCRPQLQTCICVERYLAVAQPVVFRKYKLRRYRVACLILVWVLTLGNSSIFRVFDDNTIYVLISIYCLGVVIISLCCFSIMRVLKQPGPGAVEGGRGGEKKQGTTDPQKRRAFGIILTNLVIISLSSISVAVGWASTSFSLHYHCNTFPVLLIVNIFSVMASPLVHLYREGKLPCRRGPGTGQIYHCEH